MGTDGIPYWCTSSDNRTFGPWSQVPGSILTDAAMSVRGFNFSGLGGADVLFVKGLDGQVDYSPTTVSGSVSPSIIGIWKQVPGGVTTNAAPASAWVPGTDHIDGLLFVQQSAGRTVLVNRISGYPDFGGWATVPGNRTTIVAPAATTASLWSSAQGRFDAVCLLIVNPDGIPVVTLATLG